MEVCATPLTYGVDDVRSPSEKPPLERYENAVPVEGVEPQFTTVVLVLQSSSARL